MADMGKFSVSRVPTAIVDGFKSPGAPAFIPAISLAGYWLFGEAGLLVAALLLPALYCFGVTFSNYSPPTHSFYGKNALHLRDTLIATLETALKDCVGNGRKTACFVIELDDYGTLSKRLAAREQDALMRKCGERLRSTLRDMDVIARLDGAVFSVALAPAHRLDLESAIQLAGRLQSVLEEPILMDTATYHVTASIGFALPEALKKKTGQNLLDSAELALGQARGIGQGTIRAFSPDMLETKISKHALQDRVAEALESGQITAWFQPQVCTNTGRISGFEALARWIHPQKGTIPPSDFLPALETAGLLERLGEVILFDALSALRKWDAEGLDVPTVGINFCTPELCNPKLVEKIKWELDRYELAPERLTVEVLETVVSQSENDMISRNIEGLAELGCAIDLDDFGTGHASISNIRRFAVGRIKIDRSFVTRIDEDPKQQKMVAAILTMAEQLELDTLAEGVETVGEHTLLAQLGCGHIQGFGLARPMPFEDSLAWIQAHTAKIAQPPEISQGFK
ncbi:putative bifunctional diguanylate cyclase/phosphodiesterase [Algirhabdus cladophorae]|uniref:putative bifunctional diguanylate cyclase/phosphodiesterase n=1 Tax=Algirhabdus cladophorae TaxID=3377108 RepID=UPI003B84B270